VLLRLEDHDRARSRPEFEHALLEDLEWLGLEPNLGTRRDQDARPSCYRQSDVPHVYDEAMTRLRAEGLVYACGCSRREIAHGAPSGAIEELRYPGTCRRAALPPQSGLGLRVHIGAGEEHFEDALLGPQRQDPSRQCGDLLIRDRHGFWTYQFAVVVDDIRHGVDLVIRGRDLLESTGRQLRLARLLGHPAPPVFLHHPLIVKREGVKLSKSDRDTGIRELRQSGVRPQEVLGRAAHACGLVASARPIAAADLAALFVRG
jgi:glutamyl/glutaminyl-tRNA synthetase